MVLKGAGGFQDSAISSVNGRSTAAARNGRQVWDLTTGTLTATLEGHTEHVSTARISAVGRSAVSGDNDCLVKVWDLESKTCQAPGHAGGAHCKCARSSPER